MKKLKVMIRIMFLGVFSILLLQACDDPLNVTPRDSLSPADMGVEDIDRVLNGVYLAYQNAGGHVDKVVFDLMGGNLAPPPGREASERYNIMRGEVEPDEGLLQTMWYGYYSALYRANTLLEVLEGINTNRAMEIQGVTHYFRAYGYYNLVTRFGGVPILRENTRRFVERNTEDEVWDFIIEELELAIELAPPYNRVNNYYYVSAEAAKALLARVALTVGDNERAVQLAEEVIGSGHFSLSQDYRGIFHGGSNTETIFAFANIRGEGVPPGGLFTPTNYPRGGSYFWVPTQEAMDMFSGDRRASAVFTFFGNLPMANKHPGGLQGGDPIQVSRIAELYLISAEAQGPAGISRLNELRSIRGLPAINISDEDEYLYAILDERNKELIWENFRFYDLVRTGKALEVLEHFDSEHLLRLPIPLREMNLNPNLVQNPGYF